MNHRKEVLAFEVSLYNSYFTEDRIARFLQKVGTEQVTIYIVIVDSPVAHNLRAVGKSESYIDKKVRERSRNMANRCRRAIETSGIEAIIVNWEAISSSGVYQSGVERFKKLYDQDVNFRVHARKVTADVLFNKLGVVAKESQVDVAVSFLLEELSFFWWGDEILGEDNVVNVYHIEMEILRNLISGVYDITVRPQISHRVVAVE